jgi:hypothetical protein
MEEENFEGYSTGQAKATNFIASKIDFLGAIRCQDHSYGG